MRHCGTLTALLVAPLMVGAAAAQDAAPADTGDNLAACIDLQKKAYLLGLDDEPSKTRLNLCISKFWLDLFKPDNFMAHQPPALDLPGRLEELERTGGLVHG
ncbi:hypothetical protein LXM94_07215 [Rhizobium sp. TRM95111]|uniref:hypothetical protein n=1 Tax=Rhizobium alarense TaxID=2846851 RepID=UPI001F27FF3A|nr:hypothetical protein [Rhizobium alarense]MCF3639758.1 hypothetical protein [Rhizobium alarense]